MRSSGIVGVIGVFACLALWTTASPADAPSLEYETVIPGYYLASGHGITVDEAGNTYVIGYAPEDGSILVKLGPSGNPLWTQIISSGGFADIVLDAAGDVLLTGTTSAEDFPTTPDALDDTLNGFRDVFLTKLAASDGTILYSTLLGGDYTDMGAGIALNDAGEIYLTGTTGSTDFPTTPDAYQDGPNFPEYFYTDAFVTKLNPAGTEMLYSTYFGGLHDDEAKHIGLDAGGNIIIAGTTNADDFPLVDPIQADPRGIFVSKFSADGAALLFSTYLGSEKQDHEYFRGMTVDSDGSVYLVGNTQSAGYPTTPGAFQEDFGELYGCYSSFGGFYYNCDQVFVTKLDTGVTGLVYSTFLGGTSDIAVDNLGRAHVVGWTGSADFPPDEDVSSASIFVSRFDPAGELLDYSVTVASGSANAGHGVAVDNLGGVYFTGAINVPAELYVAKIGAFESPACDDGCLIGGTCHDAGTIHPSNPCQICDPDRSRTAWSDNDGVTCDDGLFCNSDDWCEGGECSVHSGSPCAPGAICNEFYDTCGEAPRPCGTMSGGESGIGLELVLLLGMIVLVLWKRKGVKFPAS